jgi:hypothetical protein
MITGLSLLLCLSLEAQSKKYNVFTSNAIDIAYSSGFLSTHFGPKSTGRIKFLVLGTEKHELKTYELGDYNDNVVNHGCTYYYECLKVVRDKKYDEKVLFTPTKSIPNTWESYISLYYYDQMILVDFDRKCPRFGGYYQITEPSFIVLVFLDDDFLMAKRINADSKGNIKSMINMENEIRKGFSKGCYRLNSPCD